MRSEHEPGAPSQNEGAKPARDAVRSLFRFVLVCGLLPAAAFVGGLGYSYQLRWLEDPPRRIITRTGEWPKGTEWH